jgi:hypothetical protein
VFCWWLSVAAGVLRQWRYRQQMADIEAKTSQRRMRVMGQFWQARKGWQWQVTIGCVPYRSL